MESSEASSKTVNELVEIQRRTNELDIKLNHLLQELNAKMEKENLKNSDNTEVVKQLRELTGAVKEQDNSKVVNAIEELSKQMVKQGANKANPADAPKARAAD
jgi:hypothetical protein